VSDTQALRTPSTSRVRGPALVAVALLACAALWAWAAHLLWHSTVPAGLHLAHIDASRFFSRAYLSRSASYERFLAIDALLADATLIAVLAVYARRGAGLMRESAAGRIGTGMLLGMLGYAIVWLAQVPFTLAAVWWEHAHHISHQSYVAALFEDYFALGARFLVVSLALAITMALAGVLRQWWWLVAAPLFAAFALLLAYVGVYLVPNTHPLRNRGVGSDVRRLARAEGVPGTKVVVQDVSRETSAPNAEAVGFGATRRLILWDTLLDGRFSRAQIDVVAGHELGHIAHHHPLKRVGWLALFLIPAAALVALATRGRGGLARPEAVPLALFIFVALNLLATPLFNVVSRREEAEADWSALRSTRDPAAARALFEQLATTSLADPNPPAWSYVLDATHPTIVQRIAMVGAWQARQPRAR
jgi:STE24 endopeptidase